VWWLVSPQNPLKPTAGMAPFAARLRQAAAIASADHRIHVSDIEARFGTLYTTDTLQVLRRRLPRLRFVWLMGGDNLAQLPYWQRWQDIFLTVPIAVFDRPNTALKALAGKAARRFGAARLPVAAARQLVSQPPPAWIFFHTRRDPRSATQIRAEQLPLMETEPELTTEATVTLTQAPRKTPRRRQMPTAELLRSILASLDDGKAEDIRTIELAGKTTIADYMVIASGRSARQVTALTDHLEQVLPRPVSIEGKSQGDWVLIDAGDVIVHIFRPEIRAYYNLEKMWGSAFPDIEAAPEAALQ
jgi:nicotinate-nucleotide adenylyltransferase